MTLHPQGKKGVNISRRRYEVIKEFILDTLQEQNEITYEALSDLAVEKLSSTFDGKVVWYVVVVKLDLEALIFSKELITPFFCEKKFTPSIFFKSLFGFLVSAFLAFHSILF